MLNQIKCYSCSKAVCFPHLENSSEDIVETVCIHCHCKYQIFYGVVSDLKLREKQSNVIFPFANSLYEFCLLTTKGFERVCFSTPNRSQRFSLRNGDKLNVVYVVRRSNNSKMVVCLQNISTGKVCELYSRRQLWVARVVSAFIPSIVALVVTNLVPVSAAKLVMTSSIPLDIAAGVFAFNWTDFSEPSRRKLSRLSDEQKWLGEQYQLEQHIQVLHLESEENQRLLKQMRSLRQDLYAIGEELYVYQIEVISQGIKILEETLSLTQTLIEGYVQAVDMLAVQYKTSRLSEQIPVNITESVLRKLDELKEVEARKHELALRDPQDL